MTPALDIELIISTAEPAALQQLRERTGELKRQRHCVQLRATFESGRARPVRA